jgi:hypothetical protein
VRRVTYVFGDQSHHAYRPQISRPKGSVKASPDSDVESEGDGRSIRSDAFVYSILWFLVEDFLISSSFRRSGDLDKGVSALSPKENPENDEAGDLGISVMCRDIQDSALSRTYENLPTLRYFLTTIIS